MEVEPNFEGRFLDADGSYSFESVIRIIKTLSGADVVSGLKILVRGRQAKRNE